MILLNRAMTWHVSEQKGKCPLQRSKNQGVKENGSFGTLI